MTIQRLPYSYAPRGDEWLPQLPVETCKKFGPNLLGLGDIASVSKRSGALAAVFDLEGFTEFCSQLDPHLVVSEFLATFLDWLFKKIASECTMEPRDGDVLLWNQFPYYAKFLGDGVLFLWDTATMRPPAEVGNVVVSLCRTIEAYQTELLPRWNQIIADPPKRLRCGIARGEVFSVGTDGDCVGPCINLAARLQNLSGLSFAVALRGLDRESCFGIHWQQRFVPKLIEIRGIPRRELVLVERAEFDRLSETQKSKFQSPAIGSCDFSES